MRISTPAIVVALRVHGEHGAIVRLMTPDQGLQHCYVRGARGRRLRPLLVPGNQVEASLSARNDAQLPQGTVERAVDEVRPAREKLLQVEGAEVARPNPGGGRWHGGF